jgi:hypothetical protein
MPLNPGNVTVSPTGIATGAGLAKELHDALQSVQGIESLPVNVTGLRELAKYSATIAQTVLAHFITNGLITVDVSGTVAPGIPVATTGSAAAQAGQTTATGTFSGSGTGRIT